MPTDDPYARFFEPVAPPRKRPRLDKATMDELLAEVSRRRLAERDPLLDVPTCRLAEELALRDGVVAYEVGPQGRGSVSAPGPATVLVVLD